MLTDAARRSFVCTNPEQFSHFEEEIASTITSPHGGPPPQPANVPARKVHVIYILKSVLKSLTKNKSAGIKLFCCMVRMQLAFHFPEGLEGSTPLTQAQQR